jgi:hypothetical protein
VIDLDVFDHPNDFVVLLFDSQAMPDWILVRPETVSHGLTYQDHFGGVGAVAGTELAAFENPCPDGLKVVRANRIELDRDILLTFGQLDARDGDPKLGSAPGAAQRNSSRGGGTHDPRKSPDPLQNRGQQVSFLLFAALQGPYGHDE